MYGTTDILVGDVRAKLAGLPDGHFHMAVTSPPYWGLRRYLPENHESAALEIGLEESPWAYLERVVHVFADLRPKLRDDAVLYVNLGDCYATGAGSVGDCPGGGEQGARWRGDTDRVRDEKRGYRGGRNGSAKHQGKHVYGVGMGPQTQPNRMPIAGLKPKDLVGMPWRLALALQADGWYLRSAAPWVKRSSMPESVTDRPSSALEYIFLFAKSERYYWDAEAVRVADLGNDHPRNTLKARDTSNGHLQPHAGINTACGRNGAGRNRRNSDPWFESMREPWGMVGVGDEIVGFDVNPQPLADAHYASFPQKLVEPCILAGTSAKGCCPACGAPWAREFTRGTNGMDKANAHERAGDTTHARMGKAKCPSGLTTTTTTTTTGWRPTCKCGRADVVPCRVLDPFGGSGTTGLVANQHGRNATLIDLNHDYAIMARERIARGLRPNTHASTKAADAPLFGVQA